MTRRLAGLALVVVLGGCAVGPNYRRPELEPPADWQQRDAALDSAAAAMDTSTAAVADSTWWQLFGDPVLGDLVQVALQENYDVRIAAARVEEFMGLYGVAKSDFYPKVDAAATAVRGQSALSPTVEGSERPTLNDFNVSVGASWEIDLWGKIRRSSESARAQVLAAEEVRRGVVLSTVALVASSYIDLLSLDRQLEIARLTVASREHGLALMKDRRDKGDASDLELSQVESEYWLARAQIPSLEKNVVQLENALCVLLGRNPGPIPRGSVLDSLALPPVPVHMPSILLERRPDIRQAEEQLVAANARIGVAKALYFPSISLTGLFGFASGDLSKLFETNSRIWDVGGQALQPIFRGGEISGQVKAAEAVQRQALHDYALTVRNAFRDIEDALVDRKRTQEQAEAERRWVAALAVYAKLARMRYDEGLTSYLEVLDAERSLFSTELQYARTQAVLLRSVVGIYRALAGDWVDHAAARAVQPMDQVPERRSSDAEAPSSR